MPLMEPRLSRAPRGQRGNPYQGRWRDWYSHIADWKLRNPGGKLEDCARELGKAAITISYIVNTDLFRDYFAQRKAEWTANHDFAIREKLTRTVEASLDCILHNFETKRDKVPLNLATEVAMSGLERLGYGAKGPGVQVNVQQNDNRTVVVPASIGELEEARMALRTAERRQLVAGPPPVGLELSGPAAQEGVEPVVLDERGNSDASDVDA